MPHEVLSVSALVCEKYLLEKDDVFSIVRVVDILYVPQPLPENARVDVNIIAFVKTRGSGKIAVQARVVEPSGTEKVIGEQDITPELKFPDDPTIPSGFALAIAAHIQPILGTYKLKLLIDGSEERGGVVYFTLRASDRKT